VATGRVAGGEKGGKRIASKKRRPEKRGGVRAPRQGGRRAAPRCWIVQPPWTVQTGSLKVLATWLLIGSTDSAAIFWAKAAISLA